MTQAMSTRTTKASIGIGLMAWALAACDGELASAEPQLVSVQKIWDQAKYNSFTDLAKFGDRWYCTCRESDAHEHGENGKVRVIASDDGREWWSVGLLAVEDRDLRDPKLSVTPDGRLMVITGACLYEDRKMKTRDSRVAFSNDGKKWTPLATMRFKAADEHPTDGHWMWRVSWHKDRAYGVSKLLDPHRAILFTSKDGIQWQQVTRFAIPDDYHEGRDGKHPTMSTEITVRVLSDNSMLALVRQAWIGTSQPPYTDWNWHKVRNAKDHPPGTPHVCTIGGPNFVEVRGSLWGSGRRYHRPEGYQFKKTVLAEMTRDHYEPVLELPSGGDTSYAGMVWHDGLLWMSYYSSHEERPSIYLAKIRLDGASTRSRSPAIPQSQASGHLTVGDVKLLSEHGSTRATRYSNANKILTLDETTHVAWLDSGSRTMIATRDRKTGNWGRPVHVGTGIDNHGGPALTCDSQGHLHIMFGPHAESQFRHFRSAKPNDTSQWVKLDRFGSYPTYPSLVCDRDDTLHIVYRGGPRPKHPFQLLYQRMPKNGRWSDPVALATCPPDWNDYTAYHASLTIARDNSLHLAYDIYYNGSALVAGQQFPARCF